MVSHKLSNFSSTDDMFSLNAAVVPFRTVSLIFVTLNIIFSIPASIKDIVSANFSSDDNLEDFKPSFRAANSDFIPSISLRDDAIFPSVSELLFSTICANSVILACKSSIFCSYSLAL